MFKVTWLIVSAIALIAPQLCEANPNPKPTLVLSARQSTPSIPSSEIPSKCQSKCGVLNTISNCDTDSCVCSNSNSDQLASCLDCLVANGGGSLSEGQDVMNEYVDGCSSLGITVKSETIKSSSAGPLMPISMVAVAATAAMALTLA